VTMGGYNSVCEVLSLEKRALIVPRVTPRREQLIRAERLRDLGVVDVLHPDDATADALETWMAAAGTKRPSTLECIDFNGLSRLPMLVEEVLSSPTRERTSLPLSDTGVE
jgi:predicted glycosyltransferase